MSPKQVARVIKERGLKLYWVADRAGVHRTSLRQWLSGERTPKPENWELVVKTLAREISGEGLRGL